MKNYQLSVISAREKPEVGKLVALAGGKIIAEKPEVLRNLAYPVGKQKSAFLASFEICLEEEKVTDLKKGLGSDQTKTGILRFLLKSQPLPATRQEVPLPEIKPAAPAAVPAIAKPTAKPAVKPTAKPAEPEKPIPKPKDEVEEALASEEERLKLLDEKLEEILKE